MALKEKNLGPKRPISLLRFDQNCNKVTVGIVALVYCTQVVGGVCGVV